MSATAAPLKLLSGLTLALALAGCVQVAPVLGGKEPARAHPRADEVRPRAERAQAPSRPARSERSAPGRDEVALRDGIALFNDGDYNGAIRRLSGPEMNGAALRNRVAGLKYIAFSYCVTGRQGLCRENFERALRLDAGFDLAEGEHGHPLWGPEFVKAKQAVRR
ncbi:TssQ family T6SS-associated lipoprotein [Massilia sp.]|uniref:TssQ family T6SS-associated lipoprotein n=1 Tax=Massilia sp. TaxID=1882437 RepID=UPI00289FE964|nr:TssQ family T6SS-associated lipoprotein [Massilia sp.]